MPPDSRLAVLRSLRKSDKHLENKSDQHLMPDDRADGHRQCHLRKVGGPNECFASPGHWMNTILSGKCGESAAEATPMASNVLTQLNLKPESMGAAVGREWV